MNRLHRPDDHYGANVWPAVTDTILLMASIFIVVSVISMVTIAKKLHDYEHRKAGHEGTVCITYQIPEGLLFEFGQSTLKDAGKADSVLTNVLGRMAKRRDGIIKLADSEWGAGSYFLVLEAAGHADDVSGRNVNWRISTQRANAVIQRIEHLLSQNKNLYQELAIDDDAYANPGKTILRATGYCYSVPYRPVFDATGTKLTGAALKQARDANRRVEIRLFAQPVHIVQTSEVEKL